MTPPGDDGQKRGLADPRALDILTTEHWSLLSTRSLGYQEMFSRATIFVAVVSATVVSLALVSQATRFGAEVLGVALLLLPVALFIGGATILRCVEINSEDARLVSGMNLLRHAYLQIVPELEPFFITGHEREGARQPLAHGRHQRAANLAKSLTTTSGVIAALNSVLAGALASDLLALAGAARVGGARCRGCDLAALGGGARPPCCPLPESPPRRRARGRRLAGAVKVDHGPAVAASRSDGNSTPLRSHPVSSVGRRRIGLLQRKGPRFTGGEHETDSFAGGAGDGAGRTTGSGAS